MDIESARRIYRANSAVTSQDRPAFRALARQTETELQSCQQDLDAAREIVLSLESKLNEKRKDLSICHALSSPPSIRLLPSELLSIIFELACDEDKLDVRNFRRHPEPVKFTLLRVCKRWRDLTFRELKCWSQTVVVHQPSLPSRVDASFFDRTKKTCANLDRITDFYGRNLHHFHLEIAHKWSPGPLLDIILDRQAQWMRSLVLVNFNYPKRHQGLTMPALEQLAFMCGTGAESPPLRPQFNMPSLKKLFLCFQPCQLSIDNLSLPWKQISHLSLGSPCNRRANTHIYARQGELFRFLSQLPSLTYLHLSNLKSSGWFCRGEISPSTTVLPLLKTLELYDHGLDLLSPCENESQTLPYISTPSLKTFDLFFSIDSSQFRRLPQAALHQLLVPFFRRTPSLSQIRLLLFPVAHSKCYPLGIAGGFRQDILELVGDETYFTNLREVTTLDEEDNRLVQHGKIRGSPREGWLTGNAWCDRLIDRYVDLWPGIQTLKGFVAEEFAAGERKRGDSSTPGGEELKGGDAEHRSSRHTSKSTRGDGDGGLYYPATDRAVMQAIFELLGDPGIGSSVERRVYLAI